MANSEPGSGGSGPRPGGAAPDPQKNGKPGRDSNQRFSHSMLSWLLIVAVVTALLLLWQHTGGPNENGPPAGAAEAE